MPAMAGMLGGLGAMAGMPVRAAPVACRARGTGAADTHAIEPSNRRVFQSFRRCAARPTERSARVPASRAQGMAGLAVPDAAGAPPGNPSAPPSQFVLMKNMFDPNGKEELEDKVPSPWRRSAPRRARMHAPKHRRARAPRSRTAPGRSSSSTCARM